MYGQADTVISNASTLKAVTYDSTRDWGPLPPYWKRTRNTSGRYNYGIIPVGQAPGEITAA